MIHFEDLQPNAAIRGILPDALVTVVSVQWYGSTALELSAGRIADEVLTHLVGLVGANVRVTLEIEVDIPSGAPDNIVRIVTENGRTLKFQDSAFESE